MRTTENLMQTLQDIRSFWWSCYLRSQPHRTLLFEIQSWYNVEPETFSITYMAKLYQYALYQLVPEHLQTQRWSYSGFALDVFSLGWLTHWGRVTHICVGKLTIIGSENGLSPIRRQAIIWTNAELLSIGSLRTNFSEMVIKMQQFTLQKMHLKMSSAKRRLCCLGRNVLTNQRGTVVDTLPCNWSAASSLEGTYWIMSDVVTWSEEKFSLISSA